MDEPLFKVGWSGASRQRDVACKVVEADDDVFAFTCPGGAGTGRSGSAILQRSEGGYRVLGVQSAEARNAFTTLGLAVRGPP